MSLNSLEQLAQRVRKLEALDRGVAPVPGGGGAGDGDVTGPASSTNQAVARFDGLTGKLLQNSVVTIDNTGALVDPSTIQCTQLLSTILTGTAPLTVASTTLVTNLNADLLDGHHSSDFALAGSGLTGTGTAGRITQWTSASTLGNANLIGPVANLLTVEATGIYTLTVPKTGTAVVGTGTAGRITEWVTDANTVQASTLVKTGVGVLTLKTDSTDGEVYIKAAVGYQHFQFSHLIASSAIQIAETDSHSYLQFEENKTLALYGGGNLYLGGYNLTVSATGTAVLTSRTLSTTAPLTGGGDLSANRTIAIPKATNSVDGYLAATDWTIFDGKQPLLPVASVAGYLHDNGAGVKSWVGIIPASEGGTGVNNGSFALTIPATGTAALLARDQIFTGMNRFTRGTDVSNTFIGDGAGNTTATGVNAIGLGPLALTNLTSGQHNFAAGYAALYNLQGGNNNFALGAMSLFSNVSESGNVAVGNYALNRVQGGVNVGIGYYAGYGDPGVYAGQNNVFIGNMAGRYAQGSYNVLIGDTAGYNNRGAYNVMIGASAGYSSGDKYFNVMLGFYAGYYESGNYKFYIDGFGSGRASEADGRIKSLLYGDFASTPVAQQLTINGQCYINPQYTTAGVNTVLNLDVQGSGLAGDGGGLALLGASSLSLSQSMGAVKWLWQTATHASAVADLLFEAGYYNGSIITTKEFMRGRGGAAALIGFLGAAPVVRQVGDIFPALVNFGLMSTPIIPYGHMYADDIAQVITVAAANTEYKVTAGLSGGSCSTEFTFQNASELKCNRAGTYLVNWGMSISSGTNNENLDGGVVINTVTWQHSTEGSSNQNNSNNAVHVGGHGVITLALNDTVGLYVENESAGHNITVRHVNLTVMRVG